MINQEDNCRIRIDYLVLLGKVFLHILAKLMSCTIYVLNVFHFLEILPLNTF